MESAASPRGRSPISTPIASSSASSSSSPDWSCGRSSSRHASRSQARYLQRRRGRPRPARRPDHRRRGHCQAHPDRPAGGRAPSRRATGPAFPAGQSMSSWSIRRATRATTSYWGAYHELMERRGVTEPTARNLVRSSPTLIAALAVKLGDADAMIAGAYGRFRTHFNHVRDVIGHARRREEHGGRSACWSCPPARCSSPTPT